MRKIVLFIAALLFMAVPAMAVPSNIAISCVPDGNKVTVSYASNLNWIRAFGLDITVVGATITKVVAADANYRIYPGQIVIVDGNVTDYNTPYAPGDLGDANVTIEMGSLYTMDANYSGDPNYGYGKKPGKTGTLLRFYTSGSCTYAVTMNAKRGGVVMENPAEIPNVTLCSGTVCPPLPGAATNLTPADLATCVSTTASLNWTAGAGTDSHIVRFGTASPPPVVTTLPVGTTTYSPAMTNNKLYYWRIDEKENTCNGITTGVQQSFTTILAAPASCTVNGGVTTDADGKYAVSWTAPVGGGATSYQLEDSCNTSTTWVQVYSGTALTYNVKVGGGIWSYRVKASSACGSSGYTNGSNTCTISPLYCMKSTAPVAEYGAWKTWRYPACWCYKKQCKGDINGSSFGGKPVTSADLNIFKLAVNQTDAALALVANGICADLNHAAFGGKRVTSADLTIFKANVNIAEALVPCCDTAPPAGDCTLVAGDKFNFWTTP